MKYCADLSYNFQQSLVCAGCRMLEITAQKVISAIYNRQPGPHSLRFPYIDKDTLLNLVHHIVFRILEVPSLVQMLQKSPVLLSLRPALCPSLSVPGTRTERTPQTSISMYKTEYNASSISSETDMAEAI